MLLSDIFHVCVEESTRLCDLQKIVALEVIKDHVRKLEDAKEAVKWILGTRHGERSTVDLRNEYV